MEEAEKLYLRGVKQKNIAQQMGASIDTVQNWKKKYNWEEKRSDLLPNNIKELLSDVSNKKLTFQQQLFCVYVSSGETLQQSYILAYNCSRDNSNKYNCKALYATPGIREEITSLSRQYAISCDYNPMELMQNLVNIGQSDIGDFVEFGEEVNDKGKRTNFVRLKDSTKLDTSVIKSIKVGKDGAIDIQMYDKLTALVKVIERTRAGDGYMKINDVVNSRLKEKSIEEKYKKEENDAWHGLIDEEDVIDINKDDAL